MNKKSKKYIKVVYRWVQQLFDPINVLFSFPRYAGFIKDFYTYSHMEHAEKLKLVDTFPRIHEKTNITSFDKHYFYQDTWAFKKIYAIRPKSHVDVGSSVQFSGYLSAITDVKFVDIRPIEVDVQNIQPIKGDILAMPFANDSIDSLSCLSVAEHIGLGRYGDALDPEGTKKACHELVRVLSKNGNLYFALPVGKPKVCFNAHRIHTPKQILDYFSGLKLMEFSGITDTGNFIINADREAFANANYSCGLFWFKKV